MRNSRVRVMGVFALTAWCLSGGLVACGDGVNQNSPHDDVGDVTGSDTAAPPSDTTVPPDVPSDTGETSPADVVEPPPETPPIGDPIGDSVPIDHATATQIMKDNLTKHVDGLDEALTFLESSSPINNVVDMFSDDEDEADDPEGEGEPVEEPKDEGFEIDLSELRDGVIELFTDTLMREDSVTAAPDGLSLRYALNVDEICEEEAEEEESPEAKAERESKEAECAERLTKNPVRIDVTSDGVGRLNLSLKAGNDEAEVLTLQIHGGMMSVRGYVSKIRHLVEAFVDPEDFTLPSTMEGVFACEIREAGALKYVVRCAIEEAIHVVSEAEQDPYGLELKQVDDAGGLTLDGAAKSIGGALNLEGLKVSLPWQVVVDMFYDDEGYHEWTCEPNPEGGEDNCYDKWIEPEEPPEAKGTFAISISAVAGALTYTPDDDTFRLTGMSLGDATMTMAVDEDPIVSFDMNADDGRVMDMALASAGDDDMSIQVSKLDAKVTFAWHKVSTLFEDLPTFLLDETLGVRFEGAEQPTLQILNGPEDTEVKVSAGELTFWSTGMSEDVVIKEGMCITGVDEDGMTEEEKEAQHDLWGGIVGATCEAP